MATGYEIAVQFAMALTDKFSDDPAFGTYVAPPSYTVDKGRTYHRIVQHDAGGSRSVHAFVDNAGRLIKSAGWKGPQRDKDGLAVRYDLSTPHGFMDALDAATWHGGYLYK